MWPLTILEAVSTEEAMSIIDAHPDISAGFIDYYIPDENGPSVIRYLRQKNPQAKIALVSSADSEENAEEARRAGADGVVCTSLRLDIVEHRLLELVEEWSTNV